MRVAYVTPPYKGHYSVLLPLWQKDKESQLFVVRFQNDPRILEAGRERITYITLLQDRNLECATEFNDTRRKELEGVLRCFLHDFNATQVVYDFFCLEAHEACRHLGIPAICSIPAMLKETETETCSDGILPKEHMYWLWKHPYQVAIEPVVFLGPRYDGHGLVKAPRTAVAVANEIWISFGTVVPRYPGCKEKLEAFLKDLQHYAETHSSKIFMLYNVCFDRQFDHLDNVRVQGYVDLVQEFQAYPPKLLIFHGGGNTYTEALHYGVQKMLVVPFFGDQFEVARRVGNQYSGNLEEDLKHIKPVDFKLPPVLGVPFKDTFRDYFKRGDLVFGQRKNRDAFQQRFPDICMHLNHYKPFHEFANPKEGDLPVIADVYNDSYASELDDDSEFARRMKQFKAKCGNHPTEYMLVHYCLALLTLTVEEWGGKIHFVLGLNKPGPATQIELDFIHKNWDQLRNHILFYDTFGKRVNAPFFMKNRKERSQKETVLVGCSREKTRESADAKRRERNLPVLDKYASRDGYVTQRGFPGGQHWDICVETCDLRIHYYYNLQESKEHQLWPWIYLHNFQEDIKMIHCTQSDRDAQRKAQDILEGRLNF